MWSMMKAMMRIIATPVMMSVHTSYSRTISLQTTFSMPVDVSDEDSMETAPVPHSPAPIPNAIARPTTVM